VDKNTCYVKNVFGEQEKNVVFFFPGFLNQKALCNAALLDFSSGEGP
jgi:hypothetical protein